MAFDFKKEYKEFYMPKDKPAIVDVPEMNYIAVRGQGDPNTEDGEYKKAIGLLYGIAFTIKMSKKGDHMIEGYFDYVVPPLEGFFVPAKVNSSFSPTGVKLLSVFFGRISAHTSLLPVPQGIQFPLDYWNADNSRVTAPMNQQ